MAADQGRAREEHGSAVAGRCRHHRRAQPRLRACAASRRRRLREDHIGWRRRHPERSPERVDRRQQPDRSRHRAGADSGRDIQRAVALVRPLAACRCLPGSGLLPPASDGRLPRRSQGTFGAAGDAIRLRACHRRRRRHHFMACAAHAAPEAPRSAQLRHHDHHHHIQLRAALLPDRFRRRGRDRPEAVVGPGVQLRWCRRGTGAGPRRRPGRRPLRRHHRRRCRPLGSADANCAETCRWQLSEQSEDNAQESVPPCNRRPTISCLPMSMARISERCRCGSRCCRSASMSRCCSSHAPTPPPAAA